MSDIFKNTKQLSIVTTLVAAGMLSACGGSSTTTPTAVSTTPVVPVLANQLYTQTNEQANVIVHMSRNADGSLTLQNRTFTGGVGTNGVRFGDATNTSVPDSLVGRNSIAVSPDHTTLFAVNAGNNTVSTFAIDQVSGDLTLKKVNVTTGVFPTSLAFSNGHLYVSFEGGSEKLQAYNVATDGSLNLIGAYVVPANASNPVLPTQVTLSPNGSFVFVSAGTGSNSVVSYAVNPDGTLGSPILNTTGIVSPFAGTFVNNSLYLSTDITDRALAAFSVNAGNLTPINSPLTSGQAGPCWLAVTPNGQFAYVGNGSGPISSYVISSNGTLTLKNATEARDSNRVAGDSWISPDGKFFYTAYLADDQIIGYSIGSDGTLTKVGNPLPINTVTKVSIQGLVGI
ncbi:lactonase family protein [Undibacterium sp. Ji67W]|uniref:lactonase family protein n=1 Tax=Undibacterium sp. Ji67W TaxID=3413042 RepID=UPI003BF39011